jgi:chemotaxis response regulator CheB
MRAIDAVVIGASAGGIEGLSALLPALPARLRVPVFIVVHLPREHRSLLSEIFAPKCALRVSEAEDKTPVAPGCVYFAPPDYHLLLDEGPSIALSWTNRCISRAHRSMCCSNRHRICTGSNCLESFSPARAGMALAGWLRFAKLAASR